MIIKANNVATRRVPGGKLIALWLLPFSSFSFYVVLRDPYVECIYQNVCNRRQVGSRCMLYFGYKRRIGAAVKFLQTVFFRGKKRETDIRGISLEILFRNKFEG